MSGETRRVRGYYSPKQRVYTGTTFYHTPDGGEIEVTEVCREGGKRSNWDDLKDLGPVTKFSREGEKGLSQLQREEQERYESSRRRR